MLTIDVERCDGWLIVAVDGEIDMHTAPELRARLTAALDDTVDDRLLLDLSRVPFLDSTALSVMVGVHKRQRRQGHPLTIVCTSGSVRRVLSVTGLERVFAVHASRDAALSS